MYLWDTCYKDLSDCSFFTNIREEESIKRNRNHKVPPTFKEIKDFEKDQEEREKL